ncbi:hypothetical protein P261_01122 [Lachnospiraceae bacterium TWA4]|nr:hypothetical protein P261_01122 [Lachnospiraceae bacterium TWA4]
MLEGYIAQGKKSGISVKNDMNIPLMVFDARTRWELELQEKRGCLIFIDESIDYIYSKGFQQEFTKSDNYLVVISRSGRFNHLPYAIQSIYELRTEINEKIKVTRMYELYKFVERSGIPEIVVTEDSNSGAEMMEKIFAKKVIPAKGNGNVSREISKYVVGTSVIFAIVDGAAFGGFISQLMNLAKLNSDIVIFAPESFEYMVLQTDAFKRKLTDELENTWKYCDISKYLTWEQYYTELLQELCSREFGFNYNKAQIHQSLLNDEMMRQVKECLYQNWVREVAET